MALCTQDWSQAASLVPTLTDKQVHEELSLKSEMENVSALHQAIIWHPFELLSTMLKKCERVNKKSVLTITSDGRTGTPLHVLVAASDNLSGTDLETVKLLVRLQPETLQYRLETGFNPYELAEYCGKASMEMIALLKVCTEAVEADDLATIMTMCRSKFLAGGGRRGGSGSQPVIESHIQESMKTAATDTSATKSEVRSSAKKRKGGKKKKKSGKN